MALNNGDLYRMLLFLANKSSISGAINTDDFENQLIVGNVALHRELLGLPNEFGQGAPIARKQKGMSTLLDDQTNVFKKKTALSFSGGVASLPNDYFRYDAIRVSGAKEGVEVLFGGEVARRLESYIDTPDTDYPVGEFIGSEFHIYPSTILSANLVYYRNPVSPAFSFYLDVNGEVIYLPVGSSHVLLAGETGQNGETSGTMNSTSVELEFKDPEKLDVLYMIARNFGLNILRQDLTQAASAIKQQGV